MPTVQIKLADRIKIQLNPVGDQNATQVAAVQFPPVAQDLLGVTGYDEVTLTLCEATGSRPIQDVAKMVALALEAAGNALAMPSTVHCNNALDGFRRDPNQWHHQDYKADTTRLVARIAPAELPHILICRVHADRLLAATEPIQIMSFKDINNLTRQIKATCGL